MAEPTQSKTKLYVGAVLRCAPLDRLATNKSKSRPLSMSLVGSRIAKSRMSESGLSGSVGAWVATENLWMSRERPFYPSLEFSKFGALILEF